MTDFERKLLFALIGVSVILSLVIGWGVTRHAIQKREQVIQQPLVKVEETIVYMPLEENEKDRIIQTFKQKVAPVEVGPVHRAVEPFVNATFKSGIQYSYETFEEMLRPQLDAYFSQWQRRMAEETLSLYESGLDPEMIEEMLFHGGYEEKIHFMLLYERIYLIENGILIDEDH